MDKLVYEALDRSLRDIMQNDLPLGGKVVVFGGDFRQVLPVVQRGTRAQIVGAALNRSVLWRSMRKMQLTINMRVLQLAGELWFFAFYLVAASPDWIFAVPLQYLIPISCCVAGPLTLCIHTHR